MNRFWRHTAWWPAAIVLRVFAVLDNVVGVPFTEPGNRPARTINWHLRRVLAATAPALLTLANRFSRRSVLGDGPPVSLTSHGGRVAGVFATIESIGLGKRRPREIVLWLNPEPDAPALPETLRRLQRRGLTVAMAENFGPHTKYYPYVADHWDGSTPLVTADDDLVYPANWLSRLDAAGKSFPAAVNAHRAHVVGVDRHGGLLPYAKWKACSTDRPRVRTFATGLSGVWYPPAMLAALRARGDAFRAVCPRADDIWLHFVAVDEGIQVRQIRRRARHFAVLRGSQVQRLQAENVGDSGNDRQIEATYTDEVLRRLVAG